MVKNKSKEVSTSDLIERMASWPESDVIRVAFIATIRGTFEKLIDDYDLTHKDRENQEELKTVFLDILVERLVSIFRVEDKEGFVDGVPASSLVYSKMRIEMIHVGYLMGRFFQSAYGDDEEIKPSGQMLKQFLVKLANTMPTLEDATAELEKMVTKSKMTRKMLKQVQEMRIEVAAYLKGKHPKMSIGPRSLHELPEKIKEVGRQFLRLMYGRDPNTESQIVEVFRKREKKVSQAEKVFGKSATKYINRP